MNFDKIATLTSEGRALCEALDALKSTTLKIVLFPSLGPNDLSKARRLRGAIDVSWARDQVRALLQGRMDLLQEEVRSAARSDQSTKQDESG